LEVWEVAFTFDAWGLGGAAAAGVAADLLDVRVKPLSSRATNSELLALGLILYSGFGQPGVRNPNYNRAIGSAAAWGAGMLAADLFRRQFLAPKVVAPPAPPQPQFNQGAAAVGVPAASGSASLEIGNAGY
jgi:hypothetical protein